MFHRTGMTSASIPWTVVLLVLLVLGCAISYDQSRDASRNKKDIIHDAGLFAKDAIMHDASSKAKDTGFIRSSSSEDAEIIGSNRLPIEIESGMDETDARDIEGSDDTPQFHATISGRITLRGYGLEGVLVTGETMARNLIADAITNENGDYFLSLQLKWGQYLDNAYVIPFADSYNFAPPFYESGEVINGDRITGADFEANEYSIPEHAKGRWMIVEHQQPCFGGLGGYCEVGEDASRVGEILEFTDACLFEGNKCVDGFDYYSEYKTDTGSLSSRRFMYIYETVGTYDDITQTWTITRTTTTHSIGGVIDNTQVMVLERFES